MNTDLHHSVLRRVSGLIDTVLSLEKSRTFLVGGRRIYPSEVHLLLDLAAEPGANATALARRRGLTKGAVSQTLTRLAGKGLVVKTRDTARKNALDLEFTNEGRAAVAHFQERTAAMRSSLEQHLETLDAENCAVIEEFLARLTGALTVMGGER